MKSLFLSVLLFLFHLSLFSQAPVKPSSSDIQLALNKLNVLGSALMIAAHPDDENSGLIAYLANEELVDIGYLSLTRGDGGQNLIGTEIREELGVIRTQELLKAREIDGGKQFFSRANDFGFSKNPEETLEIWDREEVLSDMVWVIRKFQPDVLITRFSSEPMKTHGHHTASAILAEEAFEAAADPTRFPEQLKHLAIWQAKTLLFNTSPRFYETDEEFQAKKIAEKSIKVDIGVFNPLLGLSYTEMAAMSRSQHKCQAMGRIGKRGEKIEYLLPIKGRKSTGSVFEELNISWSRIEGGTTIGNLLEEAAINFNPLDPSKTVPSLLAARKKLLKLKDGRWKATKLEELDYLIYHCSGLYLEALSDEYYKVPGDDLEINIEALNRSKLDISIEKIDCSFNEIENKSTEKLSSNRKVNLNFKTKIPSTTKHSHPYWLEQEGSLGMFVVEDQQLIGASENPYPLHCNFDLLINGESITFKMPVVYKWQNDATGEMYRPVSIGPPLTANISEKVYVFGNEESQEIEIKVKSFQDNLKAVLKLELPNNKWKVEPENITLDFKNKEEETTVNFILLPPKDADTGNLGLQIDLSKGTENQSLKKALTSIEYDHIPYQTIFPDAQARLSRVVIEKRGEKVAYINGAGDLIPEALRQIGYQVDVLVEDDIRLEKLKTYDALVLGIRLFNKNDRIKFMTPVIWEYIKEGGTVVSQYNTNYSLQTEEVAPYPLQLSFDRVTNENAEVRFLAPDHPVLNVPNKIVKSDFDGWVQERGLYFSDKWDSNFTPILSSNDANEAPKNGGLLVAKYGEGYFVYTGYSFFRELPAGVSGAYRLFANLVSLGND